MRLCQLRHLDTLLAIVDHGSFDAAAHALGISPSAVSQRVKTLESEAGRILIRRATPPAATPAGEVLVQMARRMQLLERETATQLEEASAVALSVAVNADSLGTWFQEIFPAVGTRVDLHIRVEDEGHSLQLLRRGDCMAAVTTESAAVPGCQSEYLGLHRYVPVASPHLARQLKAGVYQWETLPAARFGSKDHMEQTFLEQQFGAFTPSPDRRETHIPAYESLTLAMVAGMGWGMVPQSSAAPLIEAGRLVQLKDAQLDVQLYWQRWKVDSRQLDSLSDHIHAAAAVGLH
ncbi:MAG TPA: ArgP/LysG family DNA-binding transcriptional regulator [Candidatus Corynebacterium gallistercoris]|uniref:ArgP/LysG family DNA-binding transcriptional regulator n=1 Tax=Candidatus Corynebacterium gallistercoris TaxID=2838530 RepID=A0A9D1UPF7_9CORY|nr:ArgP/LysG family DNA-binding transcriptional regulator [Candidatus Corynebacterium gallistercoris]